MSLSRWSGRVAVVTGASSGIGAATAVELCKSGLVTVGLARRVERIEALKSQLTAEQQKKFFAIKCDVSAEAEIVNAFIEIEKRFGGVDVLVNNAGVLPNCELTDPNNSADLRRIIDTNFMGAVICSREAVKSMRERKVDGHIIHMNSVAGHFMPFSKDLPCAGIYKAAKFALTALAEQHRQEFIKEKLNIKVTSVSPGAVFTEHLTTTNAIPKELIAQLATSVPFLAAKDIADAVVYLLSTPPNVLITELTIRPMGDTF